MSPLDNPLPCRHIKTVQSNGEEFTFCNEYNNRPEQCRKHEFQTSKCPIGISKLKIQTPDEANKRINIGYAIIKKGLQPLDKNDVWW